MPYEDRYLGLARYAGQWWEKHPRQPKVADPGGHTPNEYDWCECGSTLQHVEGSRKRRCPDCGRWVHERLSWHERTGVPYSRGDHLPLPEVDVSMNGHKVAEGETVVGDLAVS